MTQSLPSCSPISDLTSARTLKGFPLNLNVVYKLYTFFLISSIFAGHDITTVTYRMI